MKKLLAFLLALMLPLSALADGLSANLYGTLWADGIIGLLDSQSAGERYPLIEEWLHVMAEFVNAFSLASAADEQSGYGYMTLRYGEESLYSFDVTATEQGTVMRHSMLPDMPLLLSPENLYANPAALLPGSLKSAPWDGVYATFRACLNRWAQAMETTETKGHFAGDAYAGGVYRTTLRFDERDLALLLSMLLDADWPEDFASLFLGPIRQAGGDPEDIAAYLREEIRLKALDNRYRYVLHLVRDGQEEPLGLSMIVYLQDQQVASLSASAPDDQGGITLVLGWGVRGENVYLLAQTSPSDENGLRLSASLLRDAARQQNLPAVASDPSNLLMRLSLYDISLDEADIWKLVASVEALGDTAIDVTFYHAPVEGGSDNSALLKIDDQQIAIVNLDFRQTDALAAPELSAAEGIDMSRLTEEDIIALAQAASTAVAEVGIRLFQLMPTKLMTLPMNPKFFTPE